MRMFSIFLSLLLVAGIAQAGTTTITVPANSGRDVAVTVPAGAGLLTVTASVEGGHAGTLDMYARADEEFNLAGDLSAQAAYYSQNNADATASLAIADWSHPRLHPGTWHFALANNQAVEATVTFTTAVSADDTPNTVFAINFGKPSAKVDNCDIAPWSDPTPLDSDGDGENDTTLGKFRKNLLIQATTKLSSQVHSAVPITVQACWHAYGNPDDADSYTLAAAGPRYIFAGTQGMPQSNIWYALPAVIRLAGTPMCNFYPSEPCDTPDIVVRYNSDPVASKAYDDVSDEPLIIATTMHELTHGLGFISFADIQPKIDDDGDDSTPKVDNPDFGKFTQSLNDAYTLQVGYLEAGSITSFADLSIDERKAAITSGNNLVVNDPALAANLANAQRGSGAFPLDAVQLYAPSTISAGSTLSHFNDAAHPGQMMDHYIQKNFPTTLGLAEPVLEKAGWSTGPTEPPIAGAWYDPAHSGHGIDLEPIVRDADKGDAYDVVFYTYDDSGKSAFYYSVGRLRDGHYEGAAPNLCRPVYDAATKTAVYPDCHGTLSIDFTNYAHADPACAGNSGQTLALMHWTIDGLSRTWCIQPLLAQANHPVAEHDLNGLWNGGPTDSGWGFSVIDAATDDGPFFNPVLLYYYDQDNKSRWVQAEPALYAPGKTFNLYQVHGYCRFCAKQPLETTLAGTLMLDLNTPANGEPTGENKVSFDIDNSLFNRSDAPVRMYSLSPGK